MGSKVNNKHYKLARELAESPVPKIKEKRKLKKTKNYLTLDAFISWLENQPTDRQLHLGDLDRTHHPIVIYFKEHLYLEEVRRSGQQVLRIKFTEHGVKCVVNLNSFGKSLYDLIYSEFRFKRDALTAGELLQFVYKEKNYLRKLEG